MIWYIGATQVPVPRPNHGRSPMYLNASGYRSYRAEIEEFPVGLSNRVSSELMRRGLAPAPAPTRIVTTNPMLYRIRQVHSGASVSSMTATATIPVRDTVEAMPAMMTMAAVMASPLRRLAKTAKCTANGSTSARYAAISM